MASEPSLNFAIEINGKLRALASHLREAAPNPETRAFCNHLAGELLLTGLRLEELSASEESPEIDISRLVRNFERLCMYPAILRSVPQARRQLALQNLLKSDIRRGPNSARISLSKFASAKGDANEKQRNDFLRVLGSFSKRASHTQKLDKPLDGASPVGSGLVSCGDFDYYIKALYKALVNHCECQEDISGAFKRLVARIFLGGNREIVKQTLGFDIRYLAHPHTETPQGLTKWQDVDIKVPRLRDIKVQEEDDQESEPTTPIAPLVQNELCGLLSSEYQSRLCLEVINGELVYRGWSARDINEWVVDLPSVSLATVLSEGTLTHRMRLLLSVLLAKAVWQFYDSDWMIGGWTKDQVHFMYTCRANSETAYLYANKPFFSTKFDEETRRRPLLGLSHKYPKILSLGIMLLEIELGINIEDHRRPEHMRTDGTPNINTDYTTANLLFADEQEWSERESFPNHRAAIGYCLTNDGVDQCAQPINERSALYLNVVHPLEQMFEGTWKQLDEKSLGPIGFSGVLKSAQSQRRQTQRPAQNLPPLVGVASLTGLTYAAFDTGAIRGDTLPYRERCDSVEESSRLERTQDSQIDSGEAESANETNISSQATTMNLPQGSSKSSPTRKSIAADGWLKNITEMKLLLGKGRNADKYDPVKIAILDTGIDGDHHYWKFIKEYKDFVCPGNKTGIDKTGHGTNGVHLLMSIFPHAEIYVARVFEHERASSTTPSLMAAAIRYATKKSVDIIAMSSGFEKDDQKIEQAIKAANAAKVLIFAAASNFGNMGYIAFPARMHQHVMCIFSSNGHVKPSTEFIPAPSKLSSVNFCILGEAVCKFGHPDSEREHSSGTSVATSIAAAIAALIIDFSRQQDCRGIIRHREALETIEGMTAIFQLMAKGGEDQGYDCMSPWKILETDGVEEAAGKRRFICETISRALANRNIG